MPSDPAGRERGGDEHDSDEPNLTTEENLETWGELESSKLDDEEHARAAAADTDIGADISGPVPGDD